MVPVAENAVRRRELRRLVAISALGHLGLVLVLALAPRDSRSALPPRGVVTVDLIAADALRTPKLTPPPRPRPAPVKKVVLPAQPSAPKPVPKPPPVPPRPKDVDYEDFLGALRAERAEAEPTQQVASLPGAATGAFVDAEQAAWLARVRAHMRRNWILAPGFRMQRLQTRVSVRLDAQGNVVGEPRIVKRSGNRHYDTSAMRAIAKADPLPPPPEPGDWVIVFDPEDLY